MQPSSSETSFPLYAVSNGQCTCPAGPECDRAGKHPAIAWADLAPGTQVAGPEGAGRGLVTGTKSGFFVLDLDRKHGKDGFETLKARGWRLPPTRVVRTPSGGEHHYFKLPEFEVKTSGNRIGPGIDIRGEGGFVVAPGSPGKDEGTKYAVTSNLDICEAPAWLLDHPDLRRSPPADTFVAEGSSGPRTIGPSHPQWADRNAKADDACRTYEPSRGDGSASSHLCQIVKRLLWDLELPLDVVRDKILEFWNPRCTTAAGEPWPWSEAEITRTIQNSASKDFQSGIAPDGWPGTMTERMRAASLEKDVRVSSATRQSVLGAEDLERELAAGGNERATDTGNANLFVRFHGERVRYVDSWQKWLVWDGRRWQVSTTEAALGLTGDVCLARRSWIHFAPPLQPDEEETERHRQAWATRSESLNARRNMLELAKADARIRVAHTALDANPFELNVMNGTLDLRTGLLREHGQADLLTKLSPIEFDASATSPVWDAFLARVVPDDGTRTFLQRAAGYSLTGDVSEQVLFFLQGGGCNGKSTFVNILRELVGEYGKPAAPDLLLATQAEKHETQVADLCGARLAIASETEKGRGWAEARIKALTGGDQVKARRMREDFWEFTPTHKFWVCSNSAPAVRNTDDGIWRRIRKVPFNVKIEEREKDPRLLEKLRAELPGILNWALRGCLDWQAHGLGVSREIEEATEKYRASQDVFARFVDECCELEPDARVNRADLWREFKTWAEGNGDRVRRPDLTDELEQRGYEQRKTNGIFFCHGIRIKPKRPMGTP
ncbi:MAG: phage/plasmid primase, P4 family [Polyangiaceae bacterium]